MTELFNRLFNNANIEEKYKKDFKLPAIVPIVFYNGNGNWNAVKNFKNYQKNNNDFKENIINFEYIFIDVNNYSDKKLKEINNLISLIFRFDKNIDEKEFKKLIIESFDLFKKFNSKEQQNFISWFKNILNKKSENEKLINKFLENYKSENIKEVTYSMEKLFDDILEKGMEKGIEKGRTELKIDLVKKMLETISDTKELSIITGISKEEIEKIKNL